MSERKSKNIVIIALCITLIFMGVGFAALSQTLTINGTANITGTWNVHFNALDDNTAALTENTANQGASKSASYEATTGSFEFDLVKPGDQVQYKVEIKNSGNIQAGLDSISKTLVDETYISRTVELQDANGDAVAEEGLVLAEGESVYAIITYTYRPEIGNEGQTSAPELTDGKYTTTDEIIFTFSQR